jgi:small subunit ribosomal protein S2
MKEAERCGMFYVYNSVGWVECLPISRLIRRRIVRLNELERMENKTAGSIQLPRMEVAELLHEKERLTKFLGGIKD